MQSQADSALQLEKIRDSNEDEILNLQSQFSKTIELILQRQNDLKSQLKDANLQIKRLQYQLSTASTKAKAYANFVDILRRKRNGDKEKLKAWKNKFHELLEKLGDKYPEEVEKRYSSFGPLSSDLEEEPENFDVTSNPVVEHTSIESKYDANEGDKTVIPNENFPENSLVASNYSETNAEYAFQDVNAETDNSTEEKPPQTSSSTTVSFVSRRDDLPSSPVTEFVQNTSSPYSDSSPLKDVTPVIKKERALIAKDQLEYGSKESVSEPKALTNYGYDSPENLDRVKDSELFQTPDFKGFNDKGKNRTKHKKVTREVNLGPFYFNETLESQSYSEEAALDKRSQPNTIPTTDTTISPGESLDEPMGDEVKQMPTIKFEQGLVTPQTEGQKRLNHIPLSSLKPNNNTVIYEGGSNEGGFTSHSGRQGKREFPFDIDTELMNPDNIIPDLATFNKNKKKKKCSASNLNTRRVHEKILPSLSTPPDTVNKSATLSSKSNRLEYFFNRQSSSNKPQLSKNKAAETSNNREDQQNSIISISSSEESQLDYIESIKEIETPTRIINKINDKNSSDGSSKKDISENNSPLIEGNENDFPTKSTVEKAPKFEKMSNQEVIDYIMSYKNWTPDDFMLNPKFIEDDNFEPNKTIKTNQYSCTHGANCVQCKEFYELAGPGIQTVGLKWNESEQSDPAENEKNLDEQDLSELLDNAEGLSDNNSKTLNVQDKGTKSGVRNSELVSKKSKLVPTDEIRSSSVKNRTRVAVARQPSPEGFWRSDFPTTQELRKEREIASARRIQLAKERFSEAIKGVPKNICKGNYDEFAGRYIFRNKALRERLNKIKYHV